jgi:hypothetical protein
MPNRKPTIEEAKQFKDGSTVFDALPREGCDSLWKKRGDSWHERYSFHGVDPIQWHDGRILSTPEAHAEGLFDDTVTDHNGRPINRRSISAAMLYGNSTGVTLDDLAPLIDYFR